MREMTGTFTLTIDGGAASAEGAVPVVNPATRAPFAEAPAASRGSLDAAVAAARRALPGWRSLGLDGRRAALRKIAAALVDNAERLAELLTLEQGKPLADAREEVLGGAYWCAEFAGLEHAEAAHEAQPGRTTITRHVPIGVVGAIVPWNFPVILATFKLAPALLAGNTMVLKPAPTTPLTTLRIGELLRDVLPPGVLNVVSGGDELGAWMTAHEGIDKISFTGSTEVGRKVMAGAATNLKRVTLELGGNDPAIVFPDVDVEAVAKDLYWAAFRNSGQVCVAAKRLYVHKAVETDLVAALEGYAGTVRIGNGLETGVQMGPLQNARQFERVSRLLAATAADGAAVRPTVAAPEEGYFVSPTFVLEAGEDSPVVQQEQFGPVLPILRFADLEEVVGRANASPYGLGASVWTRDLDLADRVATQLEAGTVWINEAQHLSPLIPFSGHKQSGLGVENARPGLLEFTNLQVVTRRSAGA